MAYSIIQPPFTLKFSEMSKQELKEYAAWYQSSIPKRLSELEAAVKQTPRFEAWTGNFRPESLDQLGEWFAKQVDVRSRTDEEIEEIAERLSFPIELPDEELTNKTFSVAMDVGMYLAKSLKESHPHLEWQQFFGNKKSVDYGQPVLADFGPVAFNPTQIAVTTAYAIADRKQTGKRLREIFDYWSKQATEGKP